MLKRESCRQHRDTFLVGPEGQTAGLACYPAALAPMLPRHPLGLGPRMRIVTDDELDTSKPRDASEKWMVVGIWTLTDALDGEGIFLSSPTSKL